jgi:phage terminase small subunit
MKKLKPKQERFVEEYLGNAKGNATQAATNAGYSAKTAQEQGSRLLTNEVVQVAINERQKVLREKASITQERIIEEYARIAFLDPRKFFDNDGKLIDIAHLDEDTARALGGLEYQIKYEGTTGNEVAGSLTFKSKVNCKIKALNNLSELLGFKVQKQASNHDLGDIAEDIKEGRERVKSDRYRQRIAEIKRKEKE